MSTARHRAEPKKRIRHRHRDPWMLKAILETIPMSAVLGGLVLTILIPVVYPA